MRWISSLYKSSWWLTSSPFSPLDPDSALYPKGPWCKSKWRKKNAEFPQTVTCHSTWILYTQWVALKQNIFSINPLSLAGDLWPHLWSRNTRRPRLTVLPVLPISPRDSSSAGIALGTPLTLQHNTSRDVHWWFGLLICLPDCASDCSFVYLSGKS